MKCFSFWADCLNNFMSKTIYFDAQFKTIATERTSDNLRRVQTSCESAATSNWHSPLKEK